MPHGDITHIDIPVNDMARAQGFYSTLFGWEIAEPPGFEGYPMWRAPNQISGGGLAPRGEGFTQPRSYVETDSIEETLELVKASGGKVLMDKSPISELVGHLRGPGRQPRRPLRGDHRHVIVVTE